MKVVFLKLGEPTVNGRIYYKENISLPLDGFILSGNNSYCYPIDLSRVIGTFSNVEIIDNKVICDIKFNKMNVLGNMLESIDNLSFTSCGIGKLDKDLVVKDFRLTHINVEKGE